MTQRRCRCFVLLVSLLLLVHNLPRYAAKGDEEDSNVDNIQDNLFMKRGEAKEDYKDILWYHFPKSGGTTMRNILHKYCLLENFNLTSKYSQEDDCSKSPFSCVKGSQKYFSYGHTLPNYNDYKDERLLHITMLRDPLSWLLSRYQHHARKNTTSITIVQAAFVYGTKYFSFLDDKTRHLCEKWLLQIAAEELEIPEDKKNYNEDDTVPSLSLHQMHMEILKSLRKNFLSLRHNVVLATEYYEESLSYLSFLFDTPHFQLAGNALWLSRRDTKNNSDSSGKSSQWMGVSDRNRATSGQEMQQIPGSYDDLKSVMRFLEIHFAIYDEVLQRFFRQLVHSNVTTVHHRIRRRSTHDMPMEAEQHTDIQHVSASPLRLEVSSSSARIKSLPAARRRQAVQRLEGKLRSVRHQGR